MKEWLLENESQVRLAVYISLLIALMVFEAVFPRRRLLIPRRQRWFSNLLLSSLNAFCLRLLLPLLAVDFAYFCTQQQLGLLNAKEVLRAIPANLQILGCLLLLDLAIYWQHRLMHEIPWLWRLHQVHHADPDFDVTTGSRFHPLEIIFSMLFKFAVIAALGVPAIAVLLFEIILNAMSMFNHSNLNIPTKLDLALRKILVTPDMHRVHHSTVASESNKNFGFSLAIWDRCFNSYQAQPQQGHLYMRIGLNEVSDSCAINLGSLLVLPFRKSNNTIGHRDQL